MKNLFTALFLLTAFASFAQTKLTTIDLRIQTGIGVSNKPGTMFSEPFYLSGDLSATLNNRWLIGVEGGALAFRDAKYPNDKISYWGVYSRYDHQYFGLRIGQVLFRTDQFQQGVISSGADYLLIIEPNIKTSSGLLSGKSFDYIYKRFLNIPAQIDYSFLPFTKRLTRFSVSGRWNFNAYHSFPTISLGVIVPIYMLRSPE